MKWLSLNKKGERKRWKLTLFDIIIGIAVAAILITLAVSYSGLSGLGRLYVENDMSLMVSTLLSTPGEITARYPISPDYDIQEYALKTPRNAKKKVVHTPSALALSKKKKKTMIVRANMEKGILQQGDGRLK